MARARTLLHPPVLEALISLFFKEGTANGASVARARSHYLGLGWEVKPRKLSAEVGDPREDGMSDRISDFTLRSPNGLVVIQLGDDSLVVSHTGGYKNWESLEHDVFLLLKNCGPGLDLRDIDTLGVRFINRILPQERGYRRLLVSPPLIPDGMEPTVLSGFVHRNYFEFNDHAARGVLTVGTAVVEEERVDLVIDVDVQKTGQFSEDEFSLKQQLANVREIKNSLFFGCLTDQALEIFQ